MKRGSREKYEIFVNDEYLVLHLVSIACSSLTIEACYQRSVVFSHCQLCH